MYKNFCIICHSMHTTAVTIDNMFRKLNTVCDKCHGRINIEQTRRCDSCKKKLADDETECKDCKFIEKHFGFINDVDIVTDYSEEIKALIHRYKTSGDFILCQAIAEIILHHYSYKYFSQFDYVIPMPISDARLKSRGFNQIEAIVKSMCIKYHPLLNTEYRDKQMELSKLSRIQQANPFTLKAPIEENKSILLIDDIYTTGLTISHARSVLLPYKHSRIKVLAFARS